MALLTQEFDRYLDMQLPEGQSAFLWGARKTGKSFYLRKHFPGSIYYNLLDTDEYFRLLREPHLLRHEVSGLTAQQLSKPIIIDEIQKVSILLDEVHNLIESTDAHFILCGSSARKLKQQGVNLLGGRAWRYEFFPLVYPEIPNFDLIRALNQGLIPSHYLAENWQKTIRAYIQDYLTEEIKAEGLVRELRPFAEFLEVAAFSNGEIINYSNIARDCGVDAKTIKEYYQILIDTLLGYSIQPFSPKKKRENIVATPKFYYFDVGVVNGLTKMRVSQLKGAEAGRIFEHYILMELYAYIHLNDLDCRVTFWRNRAGLEVDFILGDAEVAIEVKIAETVRTSELHGIKKFQELYSPKRSIVVCNTKRRQKVNNSNAIEILPWEAFLQQLWQGNIIS